jgi:hypothetical protein
VIQAPRPKLKKAILSLGVLAIVGVAPRSLAEGLLNPIIGSVGAPQVAASESATPVDSLLLKDSPEGNSVPTAATPQDVVPSLPTQTLLVDSSTSTTSPELLPAHAVKDQVFQVIVPSRLGIDPRAHSIFLPRLYVSGVDTLLVCGSVNASGVYFTRSGSEVESTEFGTPVFRIAGPAQSVMASLNGQMGMQVISAAKSLSGSAIFLTFVAISKTSIDSALCSQGSSSNNRSISFRALGMNLNLVKETVRLKSR